jgi:hypothetical protein
MGCRAGAIYRARDSFERGGKVVDIFFISISFKHSLRKVETFIILVILVFDLAHVRFLYGFLNKGVAVVRLMFETVVD